MNVYGKFTDIYSNIKNILFLMLLLTVGTPGAWGVTITYHIINLGKLDNDGYITATRTEALQFTSTETTLGVPAQYKSPLAKNWKYYQASEVTVTYNSDTKVCTFNSEPTLSEGAAMAADADIYVTYELDETALNNFIVNDGDVCYIKFGNNKYLRQSVWNNNPNTDSDATPYILGLPGETYYEFDLSGNFEAKNTAVAIDKLGRQTVSFVSNTGIGIGVSDDETAGVTQSLEGTNKNYSLTFKPSYMNENLTAGTNNYTLDTAGDSYDKVPTTGAVTKVSAFRPYFTAPVTTNSPKMIPERIMFGNDYSGLEEGPTPTFDGALEIYAKDHKIITTSHLREPVNITIVNVGGITFASYMLQPGETQETRVNNAGVYIVNRKKLLVR